MNFQNFQKASARLLLPLFIAFNTASGFADEPSVQEANNKATVDVAVNDNEVPKTVMDFMKRHIAEATPDGSRIVMVQPDEYMLVDEETQLHSPQYGKLMSRIMMDVFEQLTADQNPNAPSVLEQVRRHQNFAIDNLAPTATVIESETLDEEKSDPFLSIGLYPEAMSSHAIEQKLAHINDPATVLVSPYPSKYHELFVGLHEFSHTLDISIYPEDKRPKRSARFGEAIADCYAILAFEQLRDQYPQEFPDSEGFTERVIALRSIGYIQSTIQTNGRAPTSDYFLTPYLSGFKDVVDQVRADGTLNTISPKEMLTLVREHVSKIDLMLSEDHIINMNYNIAQNSSNLLASGFYERIISVKEKFLPGLDNQLNLSQEKLDELRALKEENEDDPIVRVTQEILDKVEAGELTEEEAVKEASDSNVPTLDDLINKHEMLIDAILFVRSEVEAYANASEFIINQQPANPNDLMEAWKKAVLQEDEGLENKALALALENKFLFEQLKAMHLRGRSISPESLRIRLQGVGPSGADRVDIPVYKRMSFIEEQMKALKEMSRTPAPAIKSAPATKPGA